MKALLNSRILAMFLGLLLPAAVLSACIESVTPESDTNPAGSSHTITLQTSEFAEGPWIASFEVIDGPNEGEQSDGDDCEPSCTGTGAKTVTWTYESNGVPGTDTIEVCVLPQNEVSSVDELIDVIESEFGEQEALDFVNDETGGDFEDLEEFFCAQVTKTWVIVIDQPRVNVGGAVGAVAAAAAQQAQENRARAAATAPAAVVAPPSTGTGIVTPPSTGDAGLSADRIDIGAGVAAAGVGAALLAVLALRPPATPRRK
jgi:hypothetical protein